MTGKVYQRRLLLHGNTLAKTYAVNLRVQTARVPIQSSLISYTQLCLLGIFSFIFSWFISYLVLIMGTIAGSASSGGFGGVVGGAIGFECAAWLLRSSSWYSGATASTLLAVLLGSTVLVEVFFGMITAIAGAAATFGVGVGIFGGAIAGIVIGLVLEKQLSQKNSKQLVVASSLLMSIYGASLGLGVIIGLTNAFTLLLSTISGLMLVVLFIHLQLQRANTLFSSRKTGRHLIKP